jgi:hypothetical protein
MRKSRSPVRLTTRCEAELPTPRQSAAREFDPPRFYRAFRAEEALSMRSGLESERKGRGKMIPAL